MEKPSLPLACQVQESALLVDTTSVFLDPETSFRERGNAVILRRLAGRFQPFGCCPERTGTFSASSGRAGPPAGKATVSASGVHLPPHRRSHKRRKENSCADRRSIDLDRDCPPSRSARLSSCRGRIGLNSANFSDHIGDGMAAFALAAANTRRGALASSCHHLERIIAAGPGSIEKMPVTLPVVRE